MIWKYDYTQKGIGKFFKDVVLCYWHSVIKRHVMVCDMCGDYDIIQMKEYVIRVDYWTDEKLKDLHAKGYRTCEGLRGHDNVAWAGVPVMGTKRMKLIVKIHPLSLMIACRITF